MENTSNDLVVESQLENTEILAGLSDPQDDTVQEMSELERITNLRTGYFKVSLNLEDLKWLVNSCKNSKFKFVGPNEAFMVMNCYLGFSSAIARKTAESQEGSETSPTVDVQAAAIEGAALLLNRYEGGGLESAQRVFRIAVALNEPIMEMKQLDQIINALKLQSAKQDEESQKTEA